MALTSILPSWPIYVYLPITLLGLVTITLLHDIILWRRMPPGPPPIPFLGNKNIIPKSSPWIQFEAWSRQYGPIFTLWIGRRPTVMISDPVVAQELLEKRSNKYSSRPRMIAMGEIYWDNASVLVQRYGKEWSIRRKLLHQALTPKALATYKPVQEAEALRLCHQLLRLEGLEANDWEKMFERFTSSVVFSVAYGHRIDSLNARVIKQRFEFMTYSASLNVPGRYLVETLPFLKYVPDVLTPWKREIKAHGRKEAAANMALVELVKSDLAAATAAGTLEKLPPSLCRQLLDMKEKTGVPLSDRDFSFIPASLFGAGSDTTASTMCSAILALITHPQALRAAQDELDAIIGNDRTPTFADEPSLPYMGALVKEVLRWRPVAVLGGTPHASTQDDVYNGYYIPSGTTILGNSWAINLNPKYYPNPHLFEPLRFLNSTTTATPTITSSISHVDSNTSPQNIHQQQQQQQNPPELKPEFTHPSKSGHSSFGWGRRICPGADLATNSLFISLSKMIWAFDFLAVPGRRYDIFDYTQGFNVRPRRFECRVRVRSKRHKEVLEKEMGWAEEVLGVFGAFEE